MAKKSNRILINLECGVCQNRNYLTSKNALETKEKLTLRKYCKKCRRHTEHTETKIK